MDRFFIAVARLNSLLFLVLLISGLIGMGVLWHTSRDSARPTVFLKAGPHAQVKEFRFDRVDQITGTAIQLVHLTTERENGDMASGRNPTDLVNLLVVLGDGRSRWLFNSNAQHILRVKQLRAEHAESTEPTRALLLEYVKADSNQDGVLSRADARQLVVMSVDGTQQTLVLADVAQVLSVDMLGADIVTVLYQQAGAVRHARFSLQQMKVQSDQQLAPIPANAT